MQGPQLCAKPRHFCKLDVATSRMACLTYMFYNLPLTIQTIEGALWYKIAPLTPPKVGRYLQKSEKSDILFGPSQLTVSINELLCMKNSGAQIAIDFS